MGLSTKTVQVESEWTMVTNKVALLQFNDDMFVILNGSSTPPNKVGTLVKKDETYTNAVPGLYVWAKSKLDGSNIESIRVTEYN